MILLNRKKKNKAAAVLTAAACLTASVMCSLFAPDMYSLFAPDICSLTASDMFGLTAYAQQSPEFSRTAEQWALLRDNRLDYAEIPDLVHEYNATVLQNAKSFESDRNKTSADVSSSYYEMADQISANMQYPDPDSPNYASALSQYLNAQIQYENMMEKGDTNTNDAATIQLGYEKTEKTIVKQAQALMISYYQQLASIRSLQANVETASAAVDAAERKAAAGMALSTEVSSAKQKLTSAENSLQTARTNVRAAKEQLCLLLGWSYGAEVEIGAVPSVTAEELAAVNLSADIETAKSNNYTLKITKRQYENASGVTKEKLATEKATKEQNVANSVTTLYNSLMLAKAELETAQTALTAQTNALNTAARKLSAGLVNQKTYDEMQATVLSAQASVESKQLALMNAWNNYQWAVKGLADA